MQKKKISFCPEMLLSEDMMTLSCKSQLMNTRGEIDLRTKAITPRVAGWKGKTLVSKGILTIHPEIRCLKISCLVLYFVLLFKILLIKYYYLQLKL